MTAPLHQGSCLCGQITYEVDSELSEFGYCHCRSCQKASGSAHAANAAIASEHFRLTNGKEKLKRFESSPGKFRCFCGACGSPIYVQLAATPGTLRLRLGSLDTSFARRPKAHYWMSEKADWEPVTDGLPTFDKWPPADLLGLAGTRATQG